MKTGTQYRTKPRTLPSLFVWPLAFFLMSLIDFPRRPASRPGPRQSLKHLLRYIGSIYALVYHFPEKMFFGSETLAKFKVDSKPLY
jgi:hypothetical protein